MKIEIWSVIVNLLGSDLRKIKTFSVGNEHCMDIFALNACQTYLLQNIILSIKLKLWDMTSL